MPINKEQAELICQKLDVQLDSYHELTGGAHNLNFVLNTNAGRYVLRIAPPSRSETIKKEYEFLKRLDGKFGPKAIFYDETHDILENDYLVEEYVEGEHTFPATHQLIERMAAFYKSLHEEILCKPVEAFKGESYSLLEPYERFVAAKYDPHKSLLPKHWQERIDAVLTNVHSIVEENEGLFADRECFSVVQLDPSPNNVFLTHDGIKLVDWEFVRYDAPEWDIVAFIWAWELSDEQRDRFLSLSEVSADADTQYSLDVCMLIHICKILAWRVERICKIKSGQIPEGLTHHSAEKLIEDLDWIVPQIEELVQKLG